MPVRCFSCWEHEGCDDAVSVPVLPVGWPGVSSSTYMIYTGKVLHHSSQKCVSLFTPRRVSRAFRYSSARADTWRHLMAVSVDSSPTQHFMLMKHRQVTCCTVRTLSHLSSPDTWPSDFWSTSRPWHLTSCTSPLTLMTWTERAACVGVGCSLSLLLRPWGTTSGRGRQRWCPPDQHSVLSSVQTSLVGGTRSRLHCHRLLSSDTFTHFVQS